VSAAKQVRVITYKAKPVRSGSYYYVYLPARWKNEIAKIHKMKGTIVVTIEIPIIEEETESKEGEKKS